jgi:hypothetical protein
MERERSDKENCEPEEPSDSPSVSKEEKKGRAVPQVREKIGEARGNLHQRSEWFQHRSDKSK